MNIYDFRYIKTMQQLNERLHTLKKYYNEVPKIALFSEFFITYLMQETEIMNLQENRMVCPKKIYGITIARLIPY